MWYSEIWDKLGVWLAEHGLRVLAIIVIAYITHLVFKQVIIKFVRKTVTAHNEGSPDEEEQREKTLIKVFHGAIHIIVWLVAVFMILSEFGIDIAPLIAGAGIVGVAVGFGGQYLIKDIITGLFVILENQYRVGDAIEVGGHAGKVEDLTLRVTVLRDLDGVVHYIPHGEIATVSNKTKGASKINLDFGVGYGEKIDKVAELINKVGEEMYNDPKLKDKLVEAPHFLRVQELGDSAVVLKIIGETVPGEQWSATGELRKRLKDACDENGIEIPFPQMVIHKS